MPTFSDLPQELLDRIIDMCEQSPWILGEMRSYSLVCHALRPRAQAKLFENIIVRKATSVAGLHIVVAANPQLATYIKRITLAVSSITSHHDEYFVDEKTARLLGLLNLSSPETTIELGMDGDTSIHARKISAYPAIFSRVAHLHMASVEDIPLQLFGALPPLVSLRLVEVTFYPRLESVGDAELENLVKTCLSSLETLSLSEMTPVPGILIASCPVLNELELRSIKDIYPLRSTTRRTLPAPENIIIGFGCSKQRLVKTLVDSVIDLRRLRHLLDRTVHISEASAFDSAIHIKHELGCILSRCNSPTSSLRGLALDFYEYDYLSRISEVGIDISTLPTVSHLAMKFYCLEPQHDTSAPMHIRDILRTRDQNSHLKHIRITLTVAFDNPRTPGGYAQVDFNSLPTALESAAWKDIKEALKDFVLDMNKRNVGEVDMLSRGIFIAMIPVYRDDTMKRHSMLVKPKHNSNMVGMLGKWASQEVFPAIQTKVRLCLMMDCQEGQMHKDYRYDEGGRATATFKVSNGFPSLF